eukprot:g6735.t1
MKSVSCVYLLEPNPDILIHVIAKVVANRDLPSKRRHMYYDILELDVEAEENAIRMAYKKLALKYHPDKNPDRIEEASAKFRSVSEAYQVLSDPTKRKAYDQYGDAGFENGGESEEDYSDEDEEGGYVCSCGHKHKGQKNSGRGVFKGFEFEDPFEFFVRMAFSGGRSFADFEALAPKTELEPLEALSLKYQRMVGSSVLQQGTPRVPSLYEYANSVGEVELGEDMREDCHQGPRTPEFWCPLSVNMFEKYGHKMPAQIYEQFLKEAAILSEIRLTEEDLPAPLRAHDPPHVRHKHERTTKFDVLVDKIWEEVVDVWLGGSEDVSITEEWEEQINEEAKEVWAKGVLGKLTLSSLAKARDLYLHQASLGGCKVWAGDWGPPVHAEASEDPMDFLKAVGLNILLDLHSELLGLASKHVPKNLKSQRLSLILAVCKKFLSTQQISSEFSQVAYVNWAQREQLVLEEAYQLGKAQRPERLCYVCKKMLPKTKFFRSQWLSNNASLRICVDCHENEWTSDMPGGPGKDTKHDKQHEHHHQERKKKQQGDKEEEKAGVEKEKSKAKAVAGAAVGQNKDKENKPVKMSKKEKRKARQAAAAEERRKEEAREQRHQEAMEAARKLKEASELAVRQEKERREQLRKQQEKEKQAKKKADAAKRKAEAEALAKAHTAEQAKKHAEKERAEQAKKAEEAARAKRLAEKAKPTRVCRHWKMKKKCWRADQCGFLHPGSKDSGEEEALPHVADEQPHLQQTHANTQQNNLQPAADTSGRALCPSWRAQGCCNFGKGCRFLHERDHRDTSGPIEAGPHGPSAQTLGGGANSAVCQLWRQGACTRGAHCTFLHPQLVNGGGASSDERDCFAFRKAGHCAFGDNCKFQHLTGPGTGAAAEQTDTVLIPVKAVSAEVNVKGWSEHKLRVLGAASFSPPLSSVPAAAPPNTFSSPRSSLPNGTAGGPSAAFPFAAAVPPCETPAAQEWACKHCTLRNPLHLTRCDACLNPRDEGLPPQLHAVATAPVSSKPEDMGQAWESVAGRGAKRRHQQQQTPAGPAPASHISSSGAVQQPARPAQKHVAVMPPEPVATVRPPPAQISSALLGQPMTSAPMAPPALADFLTDPQLLNLLHEKPAPALPNAWQRTESQPETESSPLMSYAGVVADARPHLPAAAPYSVAAEEQFSPHPLSQATSYQQQAPLPGLFAAFPRSSLYLSSSAAPSSLWTELDAGSEPARSLFPAPGATSTTIASSLSGALGPSLFHNSESIQLGPVPTGAAAVQSGLGRFEGFRSAVTASLTVEQDEPPPTYHLPSYIGSPTHGVLHDSQ